MLKKMTSVFVLAFALNWVWEIAHSVLYLDYQGGPITHYILFRAAVVDAAMVTVLIFIAQKFPTHKSTFVVLGGIVLAVAIELWARDAGRWTYGASMPVIPVIDIGVSPVVQLAATGYFAQKLRSILNSKN